LESLVQEQRRTFASGSRSLQGGRLAQAGLALKRGLARLAAEEILLPAPADVLGTAGIKLELELLLALGRAEEVRAILNDEGLKASKHGLLYQDLPSPQNLDGSVLYSVPYHWPAYEWLDVLQAAAVGDYAQARGDLRAIRSGLHDGHERLRQQLKDVERRPLMYLPWLLSAPPPFLPVL